MFVPKLVTTLRSYSREQLAADAVAGLIVGVVAIPLCIAFAIASGVSPERGLYTGIVAGFLISALGGSRVQIGGPTGAFVVIVYGIVEKYGVDGLAAATLLAGLLLIAMGVARLGGAIKFIPHPVVTGFTSGIALIILSSQVRDALGLRMGAPPAEFFAKWQAYGGAVGTANASAIGVTAATVLIIALWPRVSQRIPGPLVALLATTAAVHLLDLPVETIGSRFGTIAAALPRPAIPHLAWSDVRALVQPAVAIALLGGIESLLSAVVADGMVGGRHRSNMELVAQGVANVASPLFGGLPATGAIARTATNVRNGGRTPVAGIVHAVVLLLVTLFFGRWAALIPMATLAGVLIVVAYAMSEWREFRALLSAPRSDVAVLLATFVLTVAVDLTVALEVGVVLSAFLFMKRMADVSVVKLVTRELADEGADDERDPNSILRRRVPPGVVVFEIAGPFFFGAAERFKDTLARIGPKPKVLIVRMRDVPAIDATGLHLLRDLVRRSRQDGTLVLLSDVHAQPLVALGRSDMLDEIGDDNLFGNVDDALDRARERLGLAREGRPAFATPTVARETPAAGTPAATRP